VTTEIVDRINGLHDDLLLLIVDRLPCMHPPLQALPLQHVGRRHSRSRHHQSFPFSIYIHFYSHTISAAAVASMLQMIAAYIDLAVCLNLTSSLVSTACRPHISSTSSAALPTSAASQSPRTNVA
jgi:hypothetical protein